MPVKTIAILAAVIILTTANAHELKYNCACGASIRIDGHQAQANADGTAVVNRIRTSDQAPDRHGDYVIRKQPAVWPRPKTDLEKLQDKLRRLEARLANIERRFAAQNANTGQANPQ